MTSDQKQYINFSEKFDELASDIDDIRDLLKEVLQYNQNIINAISHLSILSNITEDINKDTCLVDSGGQVSTIPLEHAKELGLEIFDEYGNIISQIDDPKEFKITSIKKSKKKSRY
jgi:hypothetical protein